VFKHKTEHVTRYKLNFILRTEAPEVDAKLPTIDKHVGTMGLVRNNIFLAKDQELNFADH
jgi:hypothetical protein